MQRERITITIDADLLPAVDTLIDNESIRNRSHALEYAVRRGLALSEISDAFFIYSEKEMPLATLTQMSRLCETLELTRYFVIAPSAQFAQASLWQTSFLQQLKTPPAHSAVLPADFGTAGALLLQQESISHSFFLVNNEEIAVLPARVLPAYSFHRQQKSMLTHLLYSDGAHYLPAGMSFGQAELLQGIPAGKADLASHTFPALVKEGKVSTYVYPS
jgi:hypothetical protein